MIRVINQPWDDVADDVTAAIEKAVQPLLKKAVGDIYVGLLDATQDYLKDNLAFNIASRIEAAEREAACARAIVSHLLDALSAIDDMWSDDGDGGRANPIDARSEVVRIVWQQARAAIAKARGQ